MDRRKFIGMAAATAAAPFAANSTDRFATVCADDHMEYVVPDDGLFAEELSPTGVPMRFYCRAASADTPMSIIGRFSLRGEDYGLGFDITDDTPVIKVLDTLKFSLKQTIYQRDFLAGIADDSTDTMLRYIGT